MYRCSTRPTRSRRSRCGRGCACRTPCEWVAGSVGVAVDELSHPQVPREANLLRVPEQCAPTQTVRVHEAGVHERVCAEERVLRSTAMETT